MKAAFTMALATGLALAAYSPAHAQSNAIGMPYVQADAPDYSAPAGLSVNSLSPDDNGSMVTVPIPGGGEVVVQGPDTVGVPAIPAMPGATWGTSVLAPNPVGAGPLGTETGQP